MMKRYLLFTFILSLTCVNGCISTHADAEECYQVERERCDMRGRCFDNFDVEGCKYYYKEQCRVRNIVPDYGDGEVADALASCLVEMRNFGTRKSSVDAECAALRRAEANLEIELCTLDELTACRPVVCEEYYDDDSSSDGDADSDSDADSDVPSGLDP